LASLPGETEIRSQQSFGGSLNDLPEDLATVQHLRPEQANGSTNKPKRKFQHYSEPSIVKNGFSVVVGLSKNLKRVRGIEGRKIYDYKGQHKGGEKLNDGSPEPWVLVGGGVSSTTTASSNVGYLSPIN
jgi:hypothetical protein